MNYLLIDRFQEAMIIVCSVSAPVLLAALLTGLIISFFQAVTQLQDQTLSFVPKILSVFFVLGISFTWMFGKIVAFTEKILSEFGAIAG